MAQYVPGGGSIDQELRAVAEAMQQPNEALYLAMLYVEPAKPRDGMIALADGANWNPGSGAGYYGYRAGAWRFLG